MTSKKLGALLRSVPPATAPDRDEPAATPTPTAAPAARRSSKSAPEGEGAGPEVPLQVLIPIHIRKQLAVMAAEEGVSLRALTLRAIRSLGIGVTDADIQGKRGRKNS